MESHIAGCRRCSETTEKLRALKASLQAIGSDEERTALAGARERIASSLELGFTRRAARSGLFERIKDIFTRRVSMPMPYLAFGLLALVFLVGITMGLFSPLSRTSRMMASASKVLSPQSASLEAVAQYIRQSSAQPVMIEIPKESVFSQLGNPIVVSSPGPMIQEVTTTSNEGASR